MLHTLQESFSVSNLIMRPFTLGWLEKFIQNVMNLECHFPVLIQDFEQKKHAKNIYKMFNLYVIIIQILIMYSSCISHWSIKNNTNCVFLIVCFQLFLCSIQHTHKWMKICLIDVSLKDHEGSWTPRCPQQIYYIQLISMCITQQKASIISSCSAS